ncbi:MAG: DNA repair ATPase [Candidatus Thiodiazotropha sp. (ex Monitilora ramsayi)]|nr:DNA repair ATPase [Candidatus Thiodiazotropha sp. (ex Monitilora ramsayi)]
MNKIAKQDFVFKKHMSVGEADAENDNQFLAECFTDIGDYEVLENTDSPQSIVLGRTGVGKSALLEQIEKNSSNIIRIEPEELALRHVSNSTILNFFEDLGVNLDIFYNLLWQHTLAVELIKHKYNIDCPQAKSNFIDSIKAIISGNHKKQQALNYIEEWGDKFWADTETRIREFTDKLEANLQSSIDNNVPGIKLSSQAAAQLTEEQRSEVIHYGKKVVSKVQIEKLAKIVTLLSEDIFDDPKKKVYILIDRLDENWVEDELRYKLIRALIETIRKFRNIEPVKIIITLRTDLLDRVLEKTRDSGFQREKYTSLFLSLGWKKDQLETLLDKRINFLLKHKYTNGEVSFSDIFPSKIDKTTSFEYILDRTLLRPRDAIIFVNECLKEAQGKTAISSSDIKLAEKTYSIGRVDSLKYEWYVEHPMLEKYIDMLHHKSASFKASIISDDDLEALVMELAERPDKDCDLAVKNAHSYMNSEYPASKTYLDYLRQNLLFILYKVGAVGIKVDGTSTVRWIHDRTQDLTAAKIQKTSIIYIHKILWRALAIDKRS